MTEQCLGCPQWEDGPATRPHRADRFMNIFDLRRGRWVDDL